MNVVAEVAAGTALAAIVAAAAVDVIRYEIPDGLSIAVVVLAVPFGLATPGFAWLPHVAAPAAMFAFGLLAFSRGWLGGGDVKLMSALAAWSGLAALPLLFAAISIAGGALALVYAAGRRLVVDGTATTSRLPYAVAIAAGTLWWLWASNGGPLAR